MTTGHIRVSSAGMVADAIATFLDDGFRLRSDAVSARRRLVASLAAVATPLVDRGGQQVTRLVNRAGETVWRSLQKAERVGSQVVDEAADAGREGARIVRDVAESRRSGRSGGDGSSQRQETQDLDDDLLEVVEVVEVVEPDLGPLGSVLDGGPTAADLAPESLVGEEEDADELDDVVDDELDHEPDDDELLGEGLPAEETLPEPPAVLTGATEIGGDQGDVVPELVDDVDDVEDLDADDADDVVGEAVVEQITAEPERRTPRRSTSARPRSASRPARRERPREDRREVATGGRERRG